MPSPREVTWYIEARPWNGLPGQPPGWAVADPKRMGSGVAVQLESLDDAGQSRNPRLIRNYLLTCAHVVREGQDGALFQEIFCWKHGRGYSRTREGQRLSGVHPGVCRATVSTYSPCEGVAGSSNAPLIDGNDWVLLELEDERFQKAPVVESWAEVSLCKGYSITGYPGGAGLLRHEGNSHFWETSDLVECHHSDPFEVASPAAHGTFRVSGSGRAGAGMSGGGTFDPDGNLVGLHRASEEAALHCLEIELGSIFAWLRAKHRLVPVAGKAAAVTRKLASKDPARIDVPVLAPKIAFFNRSKLRANLKQVASADNQYRVLWLDGQHGTGKSHSWYLIHHAAAEFGIRCAYCDVSEGATLEDACASIVAQLGLDSVDFDNFAMKDGPTEERLGRKLVQWLAIATRDCLFRSWVVFDGLSPGDRPSESLVEHLVTPMLEAMPGSSRLPRVTIALLGGDYPRIPILRPYVLDELVEAPARRDVERFVEAYAANLGHQLAAAELEQIVAEIAGDDPGPYEGVVLEKLGKRAVDVVGEVLR